MSQNKIGVSRKMSIEYPYKQLPCQTQGGFLQTALSAVTRRSRSCSSPVLLRRVTPDRVLAFPVTDPSRKAASHDYSNPHTDVLLSGRPRGFRWAAYDGIITPAACPSSKLLRSRLRAHFGDLRLRVGPGIRLFDLTLNSAFNSPSAQQNISPQN